VYFCGLHYNMPQTFQNRDLAWLSFNERVLQEAEDKTVPLLERLKFLGIFSNNQDEFYRVRVATLRRMKSMEEKAIKLLGARPSLVLERINKKALKLQTRFDKAYEQIIKELGKENIYILDEKKLDKEQKQFVISFFREKVRPAIHPLMLSHRIDPQSLRDRELYLAVWMSKKEKSASAYAIIHIPTNILPRFVVLPEKNNKKYIILLDDVIRLNLSEVFTIFDFTNFLAYAIKVTRDAELDIDNDISQSFVSLLQEGLEKRKTGQALRFVYDEKMPHSFRDALLKILRLENQQGAVIPGARYHNFRDFIHFPDLGRSDLKQPWLQPSIHPQLTDKTRLFPEIKKKDHLLSYPYQSFITQLDFLREAALDPAVTQVYMTLYRLAKNSQIINALINAARNGKQVMVVLELRARFDEEANILWSKLLQDEGVKVIHGVEDLKVHAKLILITRKEHNAEMDYAAIGSGNFNEETAQFYTDHTLFTSKPAITSEVKKLFLFFQKNYISQKYKTLLVAPFNMRARIDMLIKKEIEMVRTGKEAFIYFKLNNLMDRKLANSLYKASQAGVIIKLIVRGACCIIPGQKNMSENIEAISIVDNLLEHSRLFIFGNGGDARIYLGSSDLMVRNLDYRIEVLCPVSDADCKASLLRQFELYWADHRKARIWDKMMTNSYRAEDKNYLPSQLCVSQYFNKLAEMAISKKSNKK